MWHLLIFFFSVYHFLPLVSPPSISIRFCPKPFTRGFISTILQCQRCLQKFYVLIFFIFYFDYIFLPILITYNSILIGQETQVFVPPQKGFTRFTDISLIRCSLQLASSTKTLKPVPSTSTKQSCCFSSQPFSFTPFH